MKVLFIFKNENFLAPAGLCNISRAVLESGAESYLCEMNRDDVFVKIKEIKPDLIAYSASTGEAKHYLNINSRIKSYFPKIFTIMGGPHATFFSDVVKEGCLDAICVGEGEGAMFELLNALSAGKDITKIPNILTADNRDKFSIRNLVEDLDSLPFPDYGLLYDNTPMGRYPLKSIVASRGCIYDCSYCFNTAWRKIYHSKGPIVRRHSVDYITDEISYVRDRWPLSFVKFYDDVFTYKADSWLEEFSKKYRERVGLPFFVLTRADLLTEDMVKLLKSAGCHTISMSIESGNHRVRKDVLNRNMSDKQIIEAHRLCDKYKINTFTNCIIGLPETSVANDIESIDLAIKSRVNWSEFLIFHPYPGTDLGQRSISKGYYEADFSGMHTSYQYKSPLNCFTEREKNAHMNIGVLGPVAVVFPCFRSFIVKCLIWVKHNFIFTVFYYLVKMYILRKHIYVTKTNLWTSISIFVKSLKQEWFRHENKRG